jgi:hypothetical protein
MGALSVLTGIGNVANQYGEAKNEKSSEDFARAEKLKQMDVQQSYLQLAKQQEERQAQEFEFRKRAGEIVPLPDGRYWSVSKGAIIEEPRADPKELFRKVLAQADPRVQKAMGLKLPILTEENPYNEKELMKSVMATLHQEEEDVNKKDAADLAEKNRKDDAEAHRKEIETFEREERKSREANQLAVTKIMTDYRLNEKAKFMTPQERQQYESIKSLEPMATRLRKFLEDNKMTEENNYLFGDHSALMQHARAAGYKGGVKQEPKTQELIKDAAAISIMGAAPWVRIGRGKYTLEQIQQHLPKQTDTPANMYDKVTWLQDEVLENAKSSLAGLTPPGETAPTSESGTPPPGSVIHDFSK